MRQKKRKFVLAEATLEEINKQLKINVLAIIMLVLMLVLNTTQFMKDYSLLYGTLIVIMAFFLFVMIRESYATEHEKTRAC